jgi:GTPase
MRWRKRSLPLQGVTVSLTDAVLPPAVAEIVVKVVAVTACAVTGNAMELLDAFPDALPARRHSAAEEV